MIAPRTNPRALLPPCGSGLAREEGLAFNIPVD